jgi:hypothetical protein
MDIAEEDISDFTIRTDIRNGDIIIDINIQANENGEEAINGSLLFECLLGLNCSHTVATNRHQDGNRATSCSQVCL